MKRSKVTILLLSIFFCLTFLGLLILQATNTYVKSSVCSRICSQSQVPADADCILVLGCYVTPDGKPSPMLRDRLMRASALYEQGTAPKLIMSGDHGQKEYNEVAAMKRFATEEGIPSSDVFMDHAGFSTYESIYRAKDIFGAKKVVIVTQEYHLPRALYIAQQLGLDAWGVPADYRPYAGQPIREFREVLARCKDFLYCIGKPEPTFLGEAIPVSGNGDVTND